MNSVSAIIFSIIILYIAKLLTQLIPYTEQGFFCNDNEIRYPNHDETISSETMHTIYFSFSILVLSDIRRLNDIQYFWKDHMKKIILHFGIYTASVLSVSVSLNVFKSTSSRLRPNFLDICKPANFDLLCVPGSNAFVENFTCTGESKPNLHFSFPSGHAAHSIFFATFMIGFIHIHSKLPGLVKIYLQFPVFVFAVFVCLSRVRDYRHRYVDVAGGGFLGFIIGFAVIEFILRNLYGSYTNIEKNSNVQQVTYENKKTYESIP